jgi:broad specificity phosphatase PhoE
MKLLLVKHSNSNHNPHQLSHEWGLTEDGIARCQPLATHIAPYKPRRLFASTMQKTQHTAQLVSQELDNIPIIENPLLKEHSRLSNAPYGSVEDFHVRVKQMFEQPDTLIFGDETTNQALHRFSQGVEAVLKQTDPDENIVIIAHGTVNVLFTAHHNTIDIYDLWMKLKLPSIIVLDLPSFTLDSVIADAEIPTALD